MYTETKIIHQRQREKKKTHLGVQFGSRRNHSVALSLPEWRLSIRLEDDVARLTRRLGSDDALARLHLDDERLLGRVGVERHLLGLLELERHLGELSGRRRDGGDRDGLDHGRAARRVDLRACVESHGGHRDPLFEVGYDVAERTRRRLVGPEEEGRRRDEI